MARSINEIINYLIEYLSDPIPKYILLKEILNESDLSGNAYHYVKESKWYRQLAGEQWPDGSWGRFHTQNTKSPIRHKFTTTEQALKRCRELSLDKNDLMVFSCIRLMERYLKDEEKWPDTNEKHYGFEVAFKALIASNLSLFDPDNPLIKHKREICVKSLAKAFTNGSFDENVWEQENRSSNEILLRAYMVYPIWLMQYDKCMDDQLQRKFLEYIWYRKEGIYYISDIAPCDIQTLESKKFIMWLSCLNTLSGFSLFSEFMKRGITDHLYTECNRLIDNDLSLPPAAPILGRYSESWHDIRMRKADMILQILRILVKCS